MYDPPEHDFVLVSLDRPSTSPFGGALNRRDFLSACGAGVLAAARGASAQPPGRIARIGYLSPGTSAANAGLRHAFVDGLRTHGWIEHRNIAIDYRWQGERTATLEALAGDLTRLPLDLIFAVNTPASLAVKRTGTMLPVVFAVVSEPVEIGLVDSLQRPGKNFTGLTTINRELMSKRLELLKETIPGLTKVGYLANPDYSIHKVQLTEMTSAARGLGIDIHLAEVRRPGEFDGAFASMVAARATAFIVQQDHLFVSHHADVIAQGTRRRLPGMYVFSLYPRAGGFMSYGASAEDLCRRATEYVDRILKGAKPGDLPVERPTKFEMVFNMRTAKAVGVTLPPSLRLRASQIIE